ncbi:hypothetical protein NQ318_020837 [Aromia moschata]|uniref:Uncharacterized protein n=1 Tax=Aromia moschata TaxID=1265417 RepID=A0AAV8YAC4_9CUCU|nr:hypothetical protein NQ318_020837 [Aromia moschata]
MNSVDFLLTKDITYEIRMEIKRVLGKVDIRQQLDSAYRENIRRHNENVLIKKLIVLNFVKQIRDFNEKTINIFVNDKDRRADFLYK